MRKQIKNYIFSASTGTITILDSVSLTLKDITLITNVTRGVTLFQFNNTELKATMNNNTITIVDCDTTQMLDGDELKINVDDETSNLTNTNAVISTIYELLKCVKQLIVSVARPSWFDPSQNRLRQTTIIEGGTVSTCNTLSNISNMNSYQAHLPVVNQNVASWYLGCRSRIS